MSTHPALIVVSKGSYTDPEAVPDPGQVRDAIVAGLEEIGWTPVDVLHDVRRDQVAIQHETPPNPRYDAVGVVIEFAQLPTDMRRYDLSDPFDQCITTLYDTYDDIEVWIDAVSHDTADT